MTIPDPCALRFPVIALAASVGGLDALTQVLAPLPSDLPAALIVAQHLSPTASATSPKCCVTAPT